MATTRSKKDDDQDDATPDAPPEETSEEAADDTAEEAPKPVWNTTTQGPVPAGSEDQYEVLTPPEPVPPHDPNGQPIEGPTDTD
jgi:hypothetical protein